MISNAWNNQQIDFAAVLKESLTVASCYVLKDYIQKKVVKLQTFYYFATQSTKPVMKLAAQWLHASKPSDSRCVSYIYSGE